jgi:hypothetical protein
MRFPLFNFLRRENSSAARREREQQIERMFTQGLRTLADLLKQAADRLERQRLERSGYEDQGKFLKRHDRD